ncbi:MAG: ATP-binding cassette domain-containing protein [Varibaculum sp.]|nr:ATP-binding cassette domain-containing protein [Varibaculum sp.]
MGTKTAETGTVVSLRGLTVTLSGNEILHGIDADFHTGEVTAIMGPNGSGKSTLVKALVGINPISGGSVRIFGENPATNPRLRARIGYVPQQPEYASGVPATALEVVCSGLLSVAGSRGFARLLPGRGATERARAALDSVGMLAFANRRVDVLSGGQHQRVQIARALVRNPELLIMDEPLTGIDAASREQLAKIVAQLHERGVSVLVVLHETAELGELIDTALSFDMGHVVSHGEPLPPEPGHEHANHDHQHPHADPNSRPILSPEIGCGPGVGQVDGRRAVGGGRLS